jgi:hypothetical protein
MLPLLHSTMISVALMIYNITDKEARHDRN